MPDDELDPAFVMDPENPKQFWENYQYFQSEAVRKQQEFLTAAAQEQ